MPKIDIKINELTLIFNRTDTNIQIHITEYSIKGLN